MQYIRKNGMIDIDDAIERGIILPNEPELHGARKNKFWFNDYEWMYKEVDNDYSTYEEYAELICYEIAKLLQINNAEYDLATYQGKKGVITRSVVNKNEKIVSGTELLTQVYENYFVPKMHLYEKFIELSSSFQLDTIEDYEKLSDNKKEEFNKQMITLYNQSYFSIEDLIKYDEKKDIGFLYEYCMNLQNIYTPDFKEMKNGILISNNLYDIWSTVEIYCKISGYQINTKDFMSDLINMFIFDIITSQGDRHADNWSIIINKEDNTMKLAGLYDNSGAFTLNRKKAIMNINDFSNRLKTETRPGKRQGIYRQLSETIEHSFSGIKISDDDVRIRKKNAQLMNSFIAQSSDDFIERLKKFTGLLTPENIEIIFDNIEKKTKTKMPEIVKNVTREVLNHNLEMIKGKLKTEKGEQHANRKI